MTDNIICCWCGLEIKDSAGNYYEDGLAMHQECEEEANAQMKTGELT